MPKVADAHLEARRRQIMDAAIACFAREGFHRTTMQHILREAGLSAGALYRYFASKEAIVAAIAAEHHAPEGAALTAAEANDDVPTSLRDLVLASLGRLADADEQRWRRVTVQLWAEALRDDNVMAIVRDGLDGPIEVLAAVIRRAQRRGELPRGMDADAAARVFASIFEGLVLQQAFDPDLDVDAYIDAVLTLLDAVVRRR